MRGATNSRDAFCHLTLITVLTDIGGAKNKLTVTNTPTIVKRNPQMPNAVLPYYMPPFRSPNHSTNKEE